MIHVTELTRRHGPTTILKQVSLNVQRGEVAAIIGPSGGGKSTLLRCINALEPFQEGSVRVDDLQLEADHARRPAKTLLMDLRRRIGMVFQQFNLFPHLTALQNVMSGPRYALGMSREQAEQIARPLLQRVGLAERMHAKPENLSGGQQQRVAIARALAVNPRAILFDEPTSALDPKMADEVLEVIGELARSGQTMVVVTHAMSFARRVATHVHLMDAGQIVESGPPGQIFESPTARVTRDFLNRVND